MRPIFPTRAFAFRLLGRSSSSPDALNQLDHRVLGPGRAGRSRVRRREDDAPEAPSTCYGEDPRGDGEVSIQPESRARRTLLGLEVLSSTSSSVKPRRRNTCWDLTRPAWVGSVRSGPCSLPNAPLSGMAASLHGWVGKASTSSPAPKGEMCILPGANMDKPNNSVNLGNVLHILIKQTKVR